jgi:DnaJ-domain-containing protein 1
MSNLICQHCSKEVMLQYNCSECGTMLLLNEPNPFKLLGINPSFLLDKNTIQDALVVKLKLYHPDKFSLHDKVNKEVATANTSLLNKAAQDLKDLEKRAISLLSIYNYLYVSDEKTTINSENLIDFLDIQQEIEDAQEIYELENILKTIINKLEQNYNSIAKAFELSKLDNVELLLTERKFLTRIKNNLEKKLYEAV